MTKLIGVITMLALALLLGQAALAEQGGGEEKGRGRGGKGQGGQHRRPPVVFGVLQSVSGDTWTIKPQIPPHMRDRAEQKGKQLPQLPDQITVIIDDQTNFWLNGAASNAGAFKTGDEIVVKLGKPEKGGGGEGGSKRAVAIADPETAREFILEKMKEHREGGQGKGRGGKGKGGKGQGGKSGHGQRGEGQGPRVIFGTVTAASGTSITVKPEVPAFLTEKLPKRGEKLAGKLPETFTVALSTETKFMVNKQEQSANPFSSGDKVAILPQGDKGTATARVVSDYASAEARLEQRIEKRQQKRELRQQNKGR